MPPKSQPKIVSYMAALYDTMSTHADKVPDSEALVWQGRLIKTCLSVGIPEGYYKRVVDALRKLGCIEALSQGTRGTNTIFLLRYPPTIELYEEAIVKSGWRGLTSGPSLDTLSAQVEDLRQEIATRLGGIDIAAAFKDLDERVSKVETAVRSSATTTHKPGNN